MTRPSTTRARSRTRSDADHDPRPHRRIAVLLVAALQIIVTVGLLGLIVERWGVELFHEAARSLPWWALLLAMALGGVGVVAQSLRWRIVARHHRIRVPVGSAIGRCWQAAFLNSVLPGGLAGDGLRAMDDSSDAETDDGRRALASGFAAYAQTSAPAPRCAMTTSRARWCMR